MRKLGLVAVFFLLFGLLGCSAEKSQLVIAVAADEPAQPIAETISTTLKSVDKNVLIEVIRDPAEAISRLRSGEIDMAIIEEPDQPLIDIKTLAPLYPSVLHVLHNRSNDKLGFEELIRGAKIYAGPTGGATLI